MDGNALTTLRLEREGPVLSIILARPEVHDAFDDVMIAELTRAAREAGDDDSVRVVLLRSTGRSFCAGADLGWMRRVADQSEEGNLADACALEGLFAALAACPKPVIARVQGAAFGGGAGLACVADVAIASNEAKIGFPEVRLGILPAVIAPYVLRRLPAGRAQALFLTGEVVSAPAALALGLFDRVVPAVDLDGAVDATLENLLAGSPAAQAAVKELVARIAGLPPAGAKDATTRAIAAARASDDGRDGMTAFLTKGTPRWRQ